MHERKLLASLLRLLIHRRAVHELSDTYVRKDCGENPSPARLKQRDR
jgi:hypothetical protein